MTLFFRTIFCARMVSLSLQIGFHFLRAKTRRLVSMCVCVLWYYDDFFLILDDHNGSQQFPSFYSNQMVVLILLACADLWFDNSIEAFSQMSSVTNLNNANYSVDTWNLSVLQCMTTLHRYPIKTHHFHMTNKRRHSFDCKNVWHSLLKTTVRNMCLILFEVRCYLCLECIRCAYANSLMQ